MDCSSTLGKLRCVNKSPHDGEDRRGCVFVATASAYDAKEDNLEGVGNGD